MRPRAGRMQRAPHAPRAEPLASGLAGQPAGPAGANLAGDRARVSFFPDLSGSGRSVFHSAPRRNRLQGAGIGATVVAMGVWGTSLYSGDFAMDLRATIGAVARLPFDGGELLALLREREPAAVAPGDEDHTTFWLVVADQLARRGIDCPEARARALAIIDGGEDISMLERLGMGAGDLRKRGRMLAELRTRLAAGPVAGKSRRVLKKPQPLLLDVGDVLVYPTCEGQCVNPYFASRERQRVRGPVRPGTWPTIDGIESLLGG